MNVNKFQCLDTSGTTQMSSVTDSCRSHHSNRYQQTHTLRRPWLNCREWRLMHENILQVTNVISFSGLLHLLQQHLESACCQCIVPELISLSLQEVRVNERWLAQFERSFIISSNQKVFRQPWSFTSCHAAFTSVQNISSYCLLLLHYSKKRVISSYCAEFHHPTTLSTG